MVDDLFNIARVGLNHCGVFIAFQNCAPMRHRHRVYIHVHHPRVGVYRLRNLVHVARRRNPRPQIQKLVNPLRHHETHSPPHKSTIGNCGITYLWVNFEKLIRRLAVHFKVVEAAQVIVVHPRGARSCRVNIRQVRETFSHPFILLSV